MSAAADGVSRDDLASLIRTMTDGRTASANDLSPVEIATVRAVLPQGGTGRTPLRGTGNGSPLPAHWTGKVVGVSFATGYPDTLTHLADALSQKPGDEGVAAILIREPHNPFDANAIAVAVPAVESRSPGCGHIGHLPREIAAHLAPFLDAGETWQAQVDEVLINPEHTDRPGIVVSAHRVTPTVPPSRRQPDRHLMSIPASA